MFVKKKSYALNFGFRIQVSYPERYEPRRRRTEILMSNIGFLKIPGVLVGWPQNL